MKPCTVLIPSCCPSDHVFEYERRCIARIEQNTPIDLYDLLLMRSCQWSFPQKINAAMHGVQTEYVAILSNDVFVHPGWLPQLIADYESVPNCGTMAPMDSAEQGEGADRITYNDHYWALVLMRTALYRAFPLDESLPNVYADQRMSILLKKADYEICRTRNVIVEHIGLATRRVLGTEQDEGERQRMEMEFGCSELRDWVKMYAS